MLYTIDNTFDDIQSKVVVDLGCGGGILGIGSSILGSGMTIGIDIDPSAIEIAKRNADEMEVENIEFLLADIPSMDIRHHNKKQLADTVIMNPPFGTKNAGIDLKFVEKALQICSGAVYSLHKSSTRSFLQKKAKELGVEAQVLAQLRWDIPQMYKFHGAR